jgi:tetratricopeptide (TPR) repeat protein
MRIVLALLLSLLSMAAQVPPPTEFEALRNREFDLSTAGKYREAADAFERAAALKPDDASFHNALGNAYQSLSDNNRAEVEFKRALQLDPGSTTALDSLISLSYALHKIEDSRERIAQFLSMHPRYGRAHYWAGVLAEADFHADLMATRAAANVKLDEPGPLPATRAKAELIQKYATAVDQGIAHLRRAIDLDPQFDDAMASLSAFMREQAELRDTLDQYRREAAVADGWLQRSLDTRKQNASIPGHPQRIRVGGGVQLANLLRKPSPSCPPGVRISGQVRLTVVIAKNGEIQDISVISGDPVLVTRALEAVNGWIYKPTLLNGIPVEVITIVEVNFNCSH